MSTPRAEAHASVVLDALGNPVRRQILRMLAQHPRPVGRITDALADSGIAISRPAVSKHLRMLETAELVAFDRQGRRSVYRLRERGFQQARVWLDQTWDEALPAFARLAEELFEAS